MTREWHPDSVYESREGAHREEALPCDNRSHLPGYHTRMQGYVGKKKQRIDGIKPRQDNCDTHSSKREISAIAREMMEMSERDDDGNARETEMMMEKSKRDDDGNGSEG